MSFSNIRPQSAFPIGGFGTEDQVTVEEFKNILTTACDYALPSKNSKKYNRVRVLLTYWTEDDLYVKNEVEKLRDTFERGYHYDCVIDQIPAGRYQSPIQWIARKLLDLGDGTDSNDLLIFYYGGHGRSAKTPDEGPCVFVSGEWKVTLVVGRADVLYLLDWSYAEIASEVAIIAAFNLGLEVDRT
ncbi:MAG: hypothetical protein LQ337_003778 [Flavoplaca oasis]|nr:MAG: hypothetical protein LQ337_003778 [Flavoplaca oasis]